MTLNELADDIALDVPDAPLATIRDMIRWAERQFCTDADAWVVTQEPVVVAADTPYAEVEAPAGAEPMRIVVLKSEGRDLKPGFDYVQVTPTRVDFRQTPKVSILYGELAVRPKVGQSMPDADFARWADDIGHGARHRLMMLPQPWKDLQLAEYHRKLFQAGKHDAKQASRLGHQLGGAQVKLRPFT